MVLSPRNSVHVDTTCTARGPTTSRDWSENTAVTYACRGVGCALAAQLLAREQTWRDKPATYIGATNDLARFHTVSHAAGYDKEQG